MRKRMKRIGSLCLALLMALALAVPGFAATIDLSKNAITVTNVKAGATYNLYKMLDLSVDSEDDPTAYRYTVNEEWSGFFTGDNAPGATYVTIDSQGYVTWAKKLTCSSTEDENHTHTDNCYTAADVAAFGKAAAAYAKKNGISAVRSSTVNSIETGIIFGNLESGYYLITSTLGTNTIVVTTPKNPKVVVNEKNPEPTIEKQVKEDSTGEYGDENTAQIGDTVEFKTTVHAKSGAQGYVVHDKMSEGLTLNQDSIAIAVGTTPLTKGTDYTVQFNISDDCDFEITFAQTYLDTITVDIDIVITYTAILNDKAVISIDANTNDTKLNYGAESEFDTEWDQTKTYTFKFDIVKTNSDNKVLTGAKFELYDAQTGGNKIALVKESDGGYRVATADEKNAEGFTSAVIEAGKVTVKGMDANTTYWLEEIEAPAGYNKLSGRVEVKIENSNLSTIMTDDTWAEGDGGVHVVNNTGTELPSTGGMGTTLFYVVGGLLVVGAGVVLVTKKRLG